MAVKLPVTKNTPSANYDGKSVKNTVRWRSSTQRKKYPVNYYMYYYRGGFRISGKGIHMYKGAGVRFADFQIELWPDLTGSCGS